MATSIARPSARMAMGHRGLTRLIQEEIKFWSAPVANQVEVPSAPAQVLQARALPTLMGGAAKYTALKKVGPVEEPESNVHTTTAQPDYKVDCGLVFWGIALLLHGAQFRALLLCSQVVAPLFSAQIWGSAGAVWRDVVMAKEKLQADLSGEPDLVTTQLAKKLFKSLDADKLSAACADAFVAMAACLLVLQGGLAQSLGLAHALVSLLSEVADELLAFPGHEDIGSWPRLFVRLSLCVGAFSMTSFCPSVAIVVVAALSGATLAATQGLKLAQAKGFIENAGALASSRICRKSIVATAVAGAVWQLCYLQLGGGMAWYCQLAYLPAILAESVLAAFC